MVLCTPVTNYIAQLAHNTDYTLLKEVKAVYTTVTTGKGR